MVLELQYYEQLFKSDRAHSLCFSILHPGNGLKLSDDGSVCCYRADTFYTLFGLWFFGTFIFSPRDRASCFIVRIPGDVLDNDPRVYRSWPEIVILPLMGPQIKLWVFYSILSPEMLSPVLPKCLASTLAASFSGGIQISLLKSSVQSWASKISRTSSVLNVSKVLTSFWEFC